MVDGLFLASTNLACGRCSRVEGTFMCGGDEPPK